MTKSKIIFRLVSTFITAHAKCIKLQIYMVDLTPNFWPFLHVSNHEYYGDNFISKSNPRYKVSMKLVICEEQANFCINVVFFYNATAIFILLTPS